MGIFKEFKEFLDLKKGKTFLTNELYIAELGTINVYESSLYRHANFNFDRYVIVCKATGDEVNHHLIKKYGKCFGKPDLSFISSKFEKPEKTTYYKLITMNNKIMPSATPQSILDNADSGCYEVIKKAKTLNGLRKNPLIKFAETLDLNSIKDLEELFNTSTEFTM